MSEPSAALNHRVMIIARIRSGRQSAVAEAFQASDATALPHDLGVTARTLYEMRGLYVHLIDFDRSAEEVMANAHEHPGFRAVSAALEPHISAYDPGTWRSPQDAMAHPFYHWSADR